MGVGKRPPLGPHFVAKWRTLSLIPHHCPGGGGGETAIELTGALLPCCWIENKYAGRLSNCCPCFLWYIHSFWKLQVWNAGRILSYAASTLPVSVSTTCFACNTHSIFDYPSHHWSWQTQIFRLLGHCSSTFQFGTTQSSRVVPMKEHHLRVWGNTSIWLVDFAMW